MWQDLYTSCRSVSSSGRMLVEVPERQRVRELIHECDHWRGSFISRIHDAPSSPEACRSCGSGFCHAHNKFSQPTRWIAVSKHRSKIGILRGILHSFLDFLDQQEEE